MGLSIWLGCDRITDRVNKNYFSAAFHEKAIMLLFVQIERSLEFAFKVSTQSDNVVCYTYLTLVKLKVSIDCHSICF